MDVTAESLKTAYPAIMQGIEKAAFDNGYLSGLKKGTEDGLKAGVEKERARIQAVEGSLLPGHEALIESMKFDGVTTGEQAAVKILQAEKALRETKLAAYKEDAPKVVATVDAAQTEEKRAEAHAAGELMTEDQMKAAWNKDAGLRAEYGNDFDAYKAYEEANAKGLVKVYGQKGGK
jgi:hypothetical protein